MPPWEKYQQTAPAAGPWAKYQAPKDPISADPAAIEAGSKGIPGVVVPPAARGATSRYKDPLPQAVERLAPGTGIGTMVDRPTFEAAGAAAGTGVGMASPMPGGALAGGVLGAMGGSAAYDTANELTRWMQGKEQPGPAMNRFAETMENMVYSGAFETMGAGVVGAGAQAGRALARGMAGVPEAIASAVRSAQELGIQPTVATVGSRARAVQEATGRLPFVGVQRGIKRIQEQVDALLEHSAGRLGAELSKDEAADMVALGGKNGAVAAMSEIDAAYDAVRARVQRMPKKDVFPSETLGEVAEKYLQEMGEEAVIVPKGGSSVTPTAEDIAKLTQADNPDKFIQGLSWLSGKKLTYAQVRGLSRTADRLSSMVGPPSVNMAARDPAMYHYMSEVRGALRKSLQMSEDPTLAAMASHANKLHGKWKEFINNPAFKEFRAAVPGVVTRGEWYKPTTKEFTELLDVVVKEQSPKNLVYFHALVGEEAFSQIRRRAIMDALGGAVTETDAGMRINAPLLRNKLGLTTKDGMDRLDALLQGSDVHRADVEKLVGALELVGDQFIPNVSQFMTRHLMLKTAGGGASGGVLQMLKGMVLAGAGSGAFGVAGGAAGGPMGGAISTIVGMRVINEALSSRRILNWMLEAAKYDMANRPYTAFLRRIARDMFEGEPQGDG